MSSSLLGARLGALLAGGVLAVGGATAAVSAGGPPEASPSIATARPSPVVTTQPVGPQAGGPAAHGLCRAWQNHDAKGKDKSRSVAFRNLADRAGGVGRVAAYCDALPAREGGPTGDATKPPRAKPKKATTERPPRATRTAKPTKPAKPSKPVKPSTPTQ